MSETKLIDPLFNKPDDGISGMYRLPSQDVKKLSALTKKPEVSRRSRISKKGVAAALAVTAVAGLAWNAADKGIESSNDRAAEGFEASALESPKTFLQGKIELNTGVNVRTSPTISNPDEYSEGNIAFTVGDGQKLVLVNPVAVEVSTEDTWFAFTIEGDQTEGKDPATMWIKNDVLNQVNSEGLPYANVGLEGLYDSGLPTQVDVVGQTSFAVDGNQVSVGHFEN